MTFRTLLVGILAACCATFATVGFMVIYLGNANVSNKGKESPKLQVVVAKTDLELGQKLEANVLRLVDSPLGTIGDGLYQDPSELIGKFVSVPMLAGELLDSRKISDELTTLQAAPGKRVVAIDGKNATVSVGRNLVPGNRVDVIWFSSNQNGNNADEPYTLRLLQNVKVLSVGFTEDKTDKSISLELDPGMDENLIFAQQRGMIALSLKNPNDTEGVDPVEISNLRDILEQNREKRLQDQRIATELPAELSELQKRHAELQQDYDKLVADEATKNDSKYRLKRLKPGMRGVTIETKSEAVGAAGLLEPGDFVDLHLTVNDLQKDFLNVSYGAEKSKSSASCLLLKCVEVLAVDLQTEETEDGMKKEMSKSVTLVVPEAMVEEINLADQMGEIKLTLRGEADSIADSPILVTSVDEFFQTLAPVMVDETASAQQVLRIRTFRGTAAGDVPLYRVQ